MFVATVFARVVKTVVLSAGNAEEIEISSKHISSLMNFIDGIYIPSTVEGSNCGHIYMPSTVEGSNCGHIYIYTLHGGGK